MLHELVVRGGQGMTTRIVVFVGLLAWSSACASEQATDEDLEKTGMQLDKACPRDTPELTTGSDGLISEPNMELGLQARVVAASAQPPLNGSNDWTIQITDLDGEPLPDANLTWACAFMPRHNHGSNPKVVHKLGDGQYELERQNMSMDGGWLIQLWIDPSGGGTTFEGGGSAIGDKACRGPTPAPTLQFKTCVPG